MHSRGLLLSRPPPCQAVLLVTEALHTDNKVALLFSTQPDKGESPQFWQHWALGDSLLVPKGAQQIPLPFIGGALSCGLQPFLFL